MKCLDCGCGVGGPLRTIASVSGAHITGITINEYQVSRAKYHNEKVRGRIGGEEAGDLETVAWWVSSCRTQETMEGGRMSEEWEAGEGQCINESHDDILNHPPRHHRHPSVSDGPPTLTSFLPSINILI